jgi:hypothetical protein
VITTTNAGQATQLLADVASILNNQGIDYAVIGALAVAVHGVVRASVDADAVVAAAASQLRELQNKLIADHLSVELRTGGVDDPIGAMMIVTDRYGNRVDLLAGIQGLEGGVYQRSITLQPSGMHTALKIVGREDLIAMKIAAGGPKDLMDAESCIAVSGDSLDFELVRRLARHFGRDVLDRCEKILPR